MKSEVKDKKSEKTPFMFLSDEGPTLKMLDFTFHIGSTPTFLYFNLYLNTCLRSTLRLFHSKQWRFIN